MVQPGATVGQPRVQPVPGVCLGAPVSGGVGTRDLVGDMPAECSPRAVGAARGAA